MNPQSGHRDAGEPKATRRRSSRADGEASPGDRRRTRRAKSGAPMLLLVVGWSVVMLAIVFVANRLWKSNNPRDTDRRLISAPRTLSAAEGELLQEHSAACQLLLGNVLANNTPEGLSPFVINRLDSLSDIARFYRLNSATPTLETRIQASAMSVIRLPEGSAIEGRWTTDDGRVYDAVFREENGEWLLDWHHFVRFSEHPWPLFLSGDGPETAEFRLLARRRLAYRATDADDPTRPLQIVFHTPQFGRPDEPGPASPAFEFAHDSEFAIRFMAGFDAARAGRRPFRSLLPNVEPDDEMMRVRVRVRRIEGEGDDARRFELVELRAFHWLQHDDPGITPSDSDAPEP